MIEEKNLDTLTCDLLFKESYASIYNRKALEDLLESYYNVTPGTYHNKLTVNYESVLEKTRLKDVAMCNDLTIIVDNKLITNLEMYSTFNRNSLRKSKSYIMRIYSTQLNRGEDYSQIKKVTQINFINETQIKIDEQVISDGPIIDNSKLVFTAT